MPQSVVVLSSQLITTLSALAYLRWRGIRGARLHVVSLYRDDLSHSTKAFQPFLQELAAQDGHQCQFIQIPPDHFGVLRLSAGDSVLIGPEPLKCSLLLLPRLDDREGQRMLLEYQAAEVVELGESIGVETCLYSPAGRRERRRVLQRLRCSEGRAVVRQDPLVPLDQPVNLARLGCLLKLCMASRSALAAAQPVPQGSECGVLLCLPYLKVRTWRFRWRVMGRSLGWRQAPAIQNPSYLIRAVRDSLPTNTTWQVQAHPKNEAHHDLIEALLRPLNPCGLVQVLPAIASLEARLSQSSADSGLAVLGFGTNLLAVAMFVAPHHESIRLCSSSADGWLRVCVDQLFNQREHLRSWHMRAALHNLKQALSHINTYNKDE
ncbi:hypothetical protein [Synechococcus sp. PROS-U-1]|uniref:hypothetical protein n=1 Tax=Synechococcus sp. PROS-U-1 TaxID=1400866 RepID=UPI001648B65C|nr:hypothetical protein [Synechococcus sp. PROS-U-1]QNJ04576.1 hypothetical protein SynPROSU1_02995 [Synechococcus sp. PROS-U-1]